MVDCTEQGYRVLAFPDSRGTLEDSPTGLPCDQALAGTAGAHSRSRYPWPQQPPLSVCSELSVELAAT